MDRVFSSIGNAGFSKPRTHVTITIGAGYMQKRLTRMPAVTERLRDSWAWIRGLLRDGYWNQEILNLYFQGDDLERIGRLPYLERFRLVVLQSTVLRWG